MGIRIVPIGTGENWESIDQILDKAGEWPLDFDVAEYAQLICWEFAGIGQQATGWFERGDTTVVRWFADTAAAVRADAEGRAARRDMAASPPLLPPGERFRSYGLLVRP